VCGYKDLSFTLENAQVAHLCVVRSGPSANTGTSCCMVRHVTGHAGSVFCHDCCAEASCVTGHPNSAQNLLRLQVAPAAPRTCRDGETSRHPEILNSSEGWRCCDGSQGFVSTVMGKSWS